MKHVGEVCLVCGYSGMPPYGWIRSGHAPSSADGAPDGCWNILFKKHVDNVETRHIVLLLPGMPGNGRTPG